MSGPAHETGHTRPPGGLAPPGRSSAVEEPALTDQFLSAFSHELRTPLNAIVGYADLLSDEVGPRIDDDAKRSLDAIIRSAAKLTTLINDTLDLARLLMGALRAEVRRFDAASLVAEVVDTFVPLAVAKGLTLASSVPSEPFCVQTDAHRLRQTLRYIIDNAIKFTPRGEVMVHARGADHRFVVEVQDTGIGIAASDLPYVFDDFRQLDGTSTRNFDGCGLGLAVSRRLVALLGGSIEVESEPGSGSCFRIALPRELSGVRSAVHGDADPLSHLPR
jgi:signal transduction histidine kinase